MLHEGEPESVTAGGGGRVLSIDPLHQVFSGDDIGPLHRHAVVIKTGNITGLNSIWSLEFFLDFIVIIKWETCESSFEKFAAE